MRAVVSLANLMRRIGTVSATTAEMYEVMRRGDQSGKSQWPGNP